MIKAPPIYIIAEMACAHDGNINKAKKLIDAAVNANADAIQLQFFSTSDLVTPNHEVYSLLKKIQFTTSEWESVFRYAKAQGIDVWACTYDIPSVMLASKLKVDGIKVNSSDLSNHELIKLVAKSELPFTLGTGATQLEEIASAVNLVSNHGNLKNVTLMHGVQNFPTPIDQLNIARINLLQNTFNLPVGYADHTAAHLEFSKSVDLIAVGMGISILEKHITLDRREKGIDYQAALEPKEWENFVCRIREAEDALGSASLRPLSESDIKYRKFQKKSIVAACNLKEGTKVEREHLVFLRNSSLGLAPSEIKNILGKTIIADIKMFENIGYEHLGPENEK